MKATVSFDAGNEVIMSIAGHVSRAMLSRYSHVRMEAKQRAPDEIASAPVCGRREAQGGSRAAAWSGRSIGGGSVIERPGSHGVVRAIRHAPVNLWFLWRI